MPKDEGLVVDLGGDATAADTSSMSLSDWSEVIKDTASLAYLGLLVASLVTGKSSGLVKAGQAKTGQRVAMRLPLTVEVTACCIARSQTIAELVKQLEKLVKAEDIKVFPLCEQYLDS